MNRIAMIATNSSIESRTSSPALISYILSRDADVNIHLPNVAAGAPLSDRGLLNNDSFTRLLFEGSARPNEYSGTLIVFL